MSELFCGKYLKTYKNTTKESAKSRFVGQHSQLKIGSV